MEKIKKFLTILPWIILIIGITAIVAEVRYINIVEENYNNYKTEVAGTISELQSKAADLQSKADFYQEQIDAYEDKPNEWQGVISGLAEQLIPVYTADPEALDVFAKDLFMRACDKIAKNDYSVFPEFPTEEWYGGLTEPMEIAENGAKYVLRDGGDFYWYLDEYENIFTGDLLDKVLDKRFIIKEIENSTYMYVKEVEKSAKEWGVANAELTRISGKGDEIKYSVKYDREEQGTITDKGLTCTMTIKYEEGRYRISETDFGNL